MGCFSAWCPQSPMALQMWPPQNCESRGPRTAAGLWHSKKHGEVTAIAPISRWSSLHRCWIRSPTHEHQQGRGTHPHLSHPTPHPCPILSPPGSEFWRQKCSEERGVPPGHLPGSTRAGTGPQVPRLPAHLYSDTLAPRTQHPSCHLGHSPGCHL